MDGWSLMSSCDADDVVDEDKDVEMCARSSGARAGTSRWCCECYVFDSRLSTPKRRLETMWTANSRRVGTIRRDDDFREDTEAA